VAAVGDVVAGPALAHKASAEGIIAAEALCGRPVAFDAFAVPQVVFSDPEVASVGLTLHTARAAGHDADAVTIPLRAVPRAVLAHEDIGAASVVWDADTGTLLGMHIAAPHASEVIAEACTALEMSATIEDLAYMVHAHPTVGEVLGTAARHALTAAGHGDR
jgi:dihydrolipoamide dehydrogenase